MPAYTWTTGEIITAAKLQALEDEAWRTANLIASNTSTASNSKLGAGWANATASVTFTAKSSSVYVQGSTGAMGNNGVANTYNYLGINFNGIDYSIASSYSRNVNEFHSACGGLIISGLTPGTSYTATLRIQTGSGNIVINAGSTSRQTVTVWDISK